MSIRKLLVITLSFLASGSVLAETNCNTVSVSVPANSSCFLSFMKKGCNLNNMQAACAAASPGSRCTRVAQISDPSCFQALSQDKKSVECLEQYSGSLEETINTLCVTSIYSCRMN